MWGAIFLTGNFDFLHIAINNIILYSFTCAQLLRPEPAHHGFRLGARCWQCTINRKVSAHHQSMHRRVVGATSSLLSFFWHPSLSAFWFESWNVRRTCFLIKQTWPTMCRPVPPHLLPPQAPPTPPRSPAAPPKESQLVPLDVEPGSSKQVLAEKKVTWFHKKNRCLFLGNVTLCAVSHSAWTCPCVCVWPLHYAASTCNCRQGWNAFLAIHVRPQAKQPAYHLAPWCLCKWCKLCSCVQMVSASLCVAAKLLLITVLCYELLLIAVLRYTFLRKTS
jgi:hypothetical protein